MAKSVLLLAAVLLPCAFWQSLAFAQATPRIALGDAHVLVLHADGSVWAWGRNDRGQLGDGTQLDRAAPVRVPGIASAIAIETRMSSSYAVLSDGSVWAWGVNAAGQLGDGTTSDRLAPVRVVGASNVIAVSAGALHTLALRSDGSLLAWGMNAFGQLGDGSAVDRLSPVAVTGLANVRTVRAGGYWSLAVTQDGGVSTWGGNFAYALGVGAEADTSIATPTRMAGLPAPAIGPALAGDFHGIVALSDGSVWGWGFNANRQLGALDQQNPTVYHNAPRLVPNVSSVQLIAGKSNFNVAVLSSGSVVGWGSAGAGQLGNGTFDPYFRSTPVTVQGIAAPLAIDAGRYNGGAITQDGSIWMWGDNSYGQLGDGTLAASASRQHVFGPGSQGFFNALTANAETNRLPSASFSALADRAIVPVRVDLDASASSDPDGTITSYAWSAPNGAAASGARASMVFSEAGHHIITLRIADNRNGIALARRTIVVEDARNLNVRATPQVVGRDSAATLALAADGTVRSWGSGGQLGNGPSSPPTQTAPRVVDGLTGVVAISMLQVNSCALKADGTVWAWGSNQFGQLGDGTTLSRARPTQVVGLSGVRAIACSITHTLAARDDGTVWSMGLNQQGELGLGDTAGRRLATRIPGLTDVVAVAANSLTSLALKSDGTVWSWGNRAALGLGMSPTPTRVEGLPPVRAIAAGSGQNIALSTDGAVWFWGISSERMRAFPTPTQLRTLDNIVAVSTNSGNFAAVRGDGALFTWGASSSVITPLPGVGGPDPRPVVGLRDIVYADVAGSSFAIDRNGFVHAWGSNVVGTLGDGTFVDRLLPQLVLGDGGAGFLRLVSSSASPPPERVPVFPLVATSTSEVGHGAGVSASFQYRPQDVGSNGQVFVFALAPATRVQGGQAASAVKVGNAKSIAKADTPIACVLAQLNASGQMVAVTSSNLAAYLTGVLSAQGASVSILNGVPIGNVAGATFFVGYGGSGSTMINTGTNRAAVTVPGSLTCQPSAPQTGWWWNPLEDGRGFSIEKRGNNLFFAAFLYDISGRSTWYVSSGPVSLEGSLYNGELLAASGGQTLGGPYVRFPTLANAGGMTMTFNNESTGTIVWPGGTVPIQRFNIVPNGLTAAPVAGTPESGWWWNEAEAGRGFFMEWQNGTLDIAGYMYDDSGNPVWYLTVGGTSTTNPQNFIGTWWSYTGGQTLTGPWRQNARTNSNVAPLTITFSGPDTALMTLPNGRTTNLRRHRF